MHCSIFAVFGALSIVLVAGQVLSRPGVTTSKQARAIGGATWVENPNAGWSPRATHGCIEWPGRGVYVIGGYSEQLDEGDLSDVWLLPDNRSDGVWLEISEKSSWPIRHGHAVTMAWLEEEGPDYLVLAGGTGGGSPSAEVGHVDSGWDPYGAHGGEFYGDTWVSTDGKVWQPLLSGSKPHSKVTQFPGRVGHAMLVTGGGDLLLLGGLAGQDYFQDIWCRGPSCAEKADEWTAQDCRVVWCRITEKAPWDARENMAAVVVPSLMRGQPNEMILLAGGAGADSVYNDVWSSQDGGIQWTRLSQEAQWPPREGHAMAVTWDSHVLLLGGVTGGKYLSDVWASRDAGAQWELLHEVAPWSPRSGHCAVTTELGVSILGGFDGDNDLNDVWSVAIELSSHAIPQSSSVSVILASVAVMMSLHGLI